MLTFIHLRPIRFFVRPLYHRTSIHAGKCAPAKGAILYLAGGPLIDPRCEPFGAVPVYDSSSSCQGNWREFPAVAAACPVICTKESVV